MAKRRKGGSRGWRYGEFVAGLALGLVLALWAYPRLTQWWAEPLPEVLANNPSANPRFDFYDILERGEQVVEETLSAPAQESTPQNADAGAATPEAIDTAAQEAADTAAQPAAVTPGAPEPQPQAPRPVATPGMYVLQLGAFTREQEAESMKARLALVGMNARIQPVRVDRQTYYRVRIGPTNDLEQLNADRARLRGHRFDAILLKLVQ